MVVRTLTPEPKRCLFELRWHRCSIFGRSHQCRDLYKNQIFAHFYTARGWHTYKFTQAAARTAPTVTLGCFAKILVRNARKNHYELQARPPRVPSGYMDGMNQRARSESTISSLDATLDAFQCPRSRIPARSTRTHIIKHATPLASTTESGEKSTEARAQRSAEVSGDPASTATTHASTEHEPLADRQKQQMDEPQAKRAADTQECAKAGQTRAHRARDATRIAGI